MQTGRQSTAEHIHYGSDGSKRHFVLTTVPITNKNGTIHQVIHFSRDITSHRQTEQTLRQQREELAVVARLATVGEFAASIAHEIHQPLAAILNNARAAQRFLASDTPDAANEVRDALQDIVDDDRRAAEVIQNLRSFLKRRESGRTMLDMNVLIVEVIKILHGELVDRHVRVTLNLEPELPRIEGDRTGLQQVLLNLVLNGCDSMLNTNIQNRRINIQTLSDVSGIITVTVHDFGTGIDPGKVVRVFDQFYTTKPDGLGMGLSISKSIISAHGGRIHAENNPDGGAVFCFTLPAHKDDEP